MSLLDYYANKAERIRTKVKLNTIHVLVRRPVWIVKRMRRLMTLSVRLNPVLERFKSNTREDAMATSLIAPVMLTARDTAATPGSSLKSSRLTLEVVC